ncbi:MFS transporter [Acidocella sp.]|uniref:MFS transporter n=1 Tax=Acidocella sp. TaxID=50710 RepID=UPI0018370BA1|nr:MFS transporter [Acidocella sp.]NNM56894.1 MFS transporter [Acidocella sp.]
MTAAKTYTHEEILPVIRGVALCILLAALDQTIIVPAVPRMARDLGGGSHIAWIISAYLLTGTAATPIFGRLSDIYGRRRLMQPAILVFAAASLGCAAATHFWEIALWRAVQGIGGAGLMVIAQTAIADVAPPRERGRYQIYMSGMWGIASIAGPMLGGALTDSLSWRGIFWVNLPLCALAWVFSGRALRRLPPHAGAGQRIDFLGAAVLVCAITAWLVLAASGGRDFPWDSRATLILVVSGVAFTGLTAWVEHHAPAPMLPLRLFRNATVLGGLLLSATNSLCTFGGSLLLPLFFQYIKHTNAAASGLYTTPFLLAFVLLSYIGGRISRSLGRTKPTMLAALALCALGLGLLATMGASTPLLLCEAYSVLLGGGIGLVQPNITVAIQNAAQRGDVGVATGCMLLFRAIGGAFGATLAAGMLLAHGFGAGFGACALVALLAVGIAAVMRDALLRS